MKIRKYYYSDPSITIVFDDILESKAEVIVCSDDMGISISGGILPHL